IRRSRRPRPRSAPPSRAAASATRVGAITSGTRARARTRLEGVARRHDIPPAAPTAHTAQPNVIAGRAGSGTSPFMARSRARLLLLAATAAVAGVVLGARQTPPVGVADAVLGRWDLTVQGADGPYPSWLEVQLRKETELMARFVGQFGSVRYASRVEYVNGTLTVVVPVQYEPNKTDLRFEGRLVGNRLEGTTQDAQGRTLKWTGVRAPARAPSRQVSWGSPVQLFNGRDLNGWRPRTDRHPGCWSVADGILTATPPCVDLISEATFQDAGLRVEFRYPQGSNSGLYLRGRYEVQIQDDAG